MSYWLLNNIVWVAVITLWVIAKKHHNYSILTDFLKKEVGYIEHKEIIRASWLESKIRIYAQDIKKRSPHDLNQAERMLVPILNLKRYTGTIANLISFLRILLAVIVVLILKIYYLTEQGYVLMIAALFCFAIAGISDFLDGATARALEEISKLGKIIDPLADKIILASPFFILGPIFLTDQIYWMIIRQEGFLLIIALLKMIVHKLPFSMASQANYWGKVKTTVELIAAGFLFLCPFDRTFIEVSNIMFNCSVPLAIGSIVGYLSSVRRLRPN